MYAAFQYKGTCGRTRTCALWTSNKLNYMECVRRYWNRATERICKGKLNQEDRAGKSFKRTENVVAQN